MKNLQEILQWIWLSENESKIYLAVLELGKSWVTHISKQSWIKRTTIYSYINPLLEKNFLKRTIYWKRTIFTAQNPKKLIEIFDKRKDDFLKNLPLLDWIYNKNSPNPKLEFYDGKLWVKEVYNKIWSSWELVLTFFSPETFYKYFSTKYDEFLANIEKKHWWNTRSLIQNNSSWKKHIALEYSSNWKLLPKELHLEIDVIIVKNSIIMISYEPMQAIIIK